jgi:hypothetical protein
VGEKEKHANGTDMATKHEVVKAAGQGRSSQVHHAKNGEVPVKKQC